jgi:hypothetical protein
VLKRLDERPVPESRAELRAVLVVRNEALRLPHLLEHHRSLGVDRFFVVDNDSKDGTRDLLLEQPDVHVFFTDASFRDEKALWRLELLESFCEDRWVLHLDGDELFVFPGCDELRIPDLCRFADSEGARGVIGPLVDMYPPEPLDALGYEPGTSLIEACPYFDTRGYDLVYRHKNVSPPFRLYGGARARVLCEGAPFDVGLRSRLAGWLFDPLRTRAAWPSRLPLLGRAIDHLARSGRPESLPLLGKIPLLRWSRSLGIRVSNLDALHWVKPAIPLASCWGALLHFKFLGDFRERVGEAVTYKLYGPADPEYERYHAALSRGELPKLLGPWSRRYESVESLVEVGLVRRSESFDEFHAAR